MNKSLIRKEIFKYRASLDKDFVDVNSKIIFNRIFNSDYYKNAKGVFLYASYNNEVDTNYALSRILDDGKFVCMPKVCIEDENLCKMNFYKISSFSDLISGYKGILEPANHLSCYDSYTEEAIIIVPMVAFDENLGRVGYGKGYYDRYLSSHNFKKVIGVAFEGQKVENIDKNPFDINLDVIYTELKEY